MSNAVALFAGQKVPARILARQKKSKVNYGGIVGSGVRMNRISLKGGRFHLKAGGEIVSTSDSNHLDVGIAAHMDTVGRQYYGKAWDESGEDNSGPVCFSQDGAKPDAGVPEQQSKFCKSCPRNQKGSGADGKSKACSSIARMVVFLSDDEHQRPYVIDAKGMSIFGKANPEAGKFNLQAYLATLQHQNLAANEIWTRIAFDKKSAVPKLTFQALGYIDDDVALQFLEEQGRLEETKLMLRVGGSAPVVKDEEEEEDEPQAEAAYDEGEEAEPVRPIKTRFKPMAPAVADEPAAPIKPRLGRPPKVRVAEETEDAEVVEDTPPVVEDTPPARSRLGRPPKAPTVAQESDEDEPAQTAPKFKSQAVRARPEPKAVASIDEIDDALADLIPKNWKAPA